MPTDPILTLRNALADLGFPSVYELHEHTIRAYYSTISDAWLASDQTEDDAIACDAARILIDCEFSA